MKTPLIWIPVVSTMIMAGCTTSPVTKNTVSTAVTASGPTTVEPLLPPPPPSVYDVRNVDTPPVPLTNTSLNNLAWARIAPLLPRGGAGLATIVFTVSDRGFVREATVYSATEPVFGTTAALTVKDVKFEPALKDNRTVACRMIWTVNYDVRDSEPMVYTKPTQRGTGAFQ